MLSDQLAASAGSSGGVRVVSVDSLSGLDDALRLGLLFEKLIEERETQAAES